MKRSGLLLGTKIGLSFSGNSMILLPCGTQFLQHVPTGAVSRGSSAARIPSPEELCAQEIFLFPLLPGV